MKTDHQHREILCSAKRVVVKAGSKVLVQRSGRPDRARMQKLVTELTQLHKTGVETALVSSGAVGAGLDALQQRIRPSDMADLQMAASIGQHRLMGIYGDLFSKNKCTIGQVLLTHDVLKDRERHLNARNTLLHLIANRIIPVINENDTISTEEIKFGDNDVLAALVSILIDADALILLSTTDGLREPTANGRTRRVSYIDEVNDSILAMIEDKQDVLSTGGMTSKLQSAELAAHNGIPVVIANGRKDEVLARILRGEDEGTLLFPKDKQISKRKRWIAFFNRVEGKITIDKGAEKALLTGHSLLPVGILKQEGDFKLGAMVEIISQDGHTIGRGLVEADSQELAARNSSEAPAKEQPIIHYDNLVLL
ncbi:MAG: glutamate 5-kinase [Pontiellaceae bacterium]